MIQYSGPMEDSSLLVPSPSCPVYSEGHQVLLRSGSWLVAIWREIVQIAKPDFIVVYCLDLSCTLLAVCTCIKYWLRYL